MSRKRRPRPAPKLTLVQREVGRFLKTLRKMMTDRGYSQTDVEAKLGWFHPRLSLTFKGSLRLHVETVLAMLVAIGVHPGTFYRELWRDFDSMGEGPNLAEYKYSEVNPPDGRPKFTRPRQTGDATGG